MYGLGYHAIDICLSCSHITFSFTNAPSISEIGVTFDQNEATRSLTCVPDGNPQTYTYYQWRHKSKYGVLIRELDGGLNGVLTLPRSCLFYIPFIVT
jgi:hypothetical protein